MKIEKLVEYLAEPLETSVVLTTNRLDALNVLYVNRAFCQMTGYSKEELVGHNPKMLQGKETNSLRTKTLRQSLQQGQMHRTMFVNYRKNGEKYHCEICAFPIHNDANEVTHYIAFEREAVRKPGRPKAINPNDYWWIPDWAKEVANG